MDHIAKGNSEGFRANKMGQIALGQSAVYGLQPMNCTRFVAVNPAEFPLCGLVHAAIMIVMAIIPNSASNLFEHLPNGLGDQFCIYKYLYFSNDNL